MNVPGTVAELGDPIALGRTAQIYGLPDTKVLKLYAAGIPASEVATERANCEEAVALGATPIVCHGQVEIEGRHGLVLDAAEGGSLNSLAERNILKLREAGRILAREHARVHRCRTTGHDDVREVAAGLLDRPSFDFLGADGRAKVAERLRSLPDGDVLLHMDFHTQNVFAQGDGWAVIDWQTSMRGAAACDVASTMLLLRDAELWPGTPRLKQLLYDTVRRALAAAYLAEYLQVTGMDPQEVTRWRLAALVLRMGTWQIASEQERFAAQVRELIGAS
ncbi:MAG: aminoglycoside phosphotransferase family protein [Actinobacteria bacterium]|nr:aminoglycoside phosphotransferase family protein [Actinomycetota bacterium]